MTYPLALADMPAATVWYLALYLITLLLHVVPMSYVLAGSWYLAACSLSKRQPAGHWPLCDLTRDWLPFFISVAITAGVAPLLFLQILYQKEFYTANLLGFHRWMFMLPVLILGFYATYLTKSSLWHAKPRWITILSSSIAAACFTFAAWTWTENHLLSLQSQSVWTSQFINNRWVFASREILPRLGIWLSGVFVGFALLVATQHKVMGDKTVSEVDERQAALSRHLVKIIWSGLGVAMLFGVISLAIIPTPSRAALASWRNWPIGLLLAVGGLSLLLITVRDHSRLLSGTWPMLTSWFGYVCLLLGVALAREQIRLSLISIENHYEQHAFASKVAGLPVFLVFFVLCGGMIGYCLRLVSKELNPPEDQ